MALIVHEMKMFIIVDINPSHLFGEL